ncbi:MAG: phosphohydrolase [Saprospiraceae bacterium]|nr:phosphohydrolase [Saprospiraceae bacterium]
MKENSTHYAMDEVVFDQLKREVIGELEKKLPPYLKYHSVDHTAGVLTDAILIANEEGVSESELFKIKIAALLHDTGFMFTYQNHEEASCAYAKVILPKYHTSPEDISHICEIIMATKIPQSPKDQCGSILADADLAYLGTEDFSTISSLLYAELKYFNPLLELQAWNEIQIKFLKQHQYFTQYCITHKTSNKKTHLERLMGGP